MSISGYLLPFPDPGAADLMSDHLEQVVQTTGPGKILIRASVPENSNQGPANPSESSGRFARKKLEIFRLEGIDWVSEDVTISDSYCELEEVTWEIHSVETFKCKLTNMSGREGQFSLGCTFEASEVQ